MSEHVLVAEQRAFDQLPAGATHLTLGTTGVRALTSLLRHTKTLEVLTLDDVAVTDLSVLARLPRLRTVALYDCRQLRDHAVLGQLPRLETLTVGYCWAERGFHFAGSTPSSARSGCGRSHSSGGLGAPSSPSCVN